MTYESSTPKALVSVVIVNYRSGEMLRRCLRSLFAQTYPNFEVIVIDNASSDGSLRCLSEFPGVTIIRNLRNLGFAKAQNQGLKLARGAYCLPLNYDVVLTPEFLDQLVRAMESSGRVGLVTGRLLQMGPGGERTNVIYSTGHLMPANRFPEHRGAGEPDCGQYDTATEVFGAAGAAPLYRREMLEDIAFRGEYFDESLFTWYEDVDIDWRAKRLGWNCLYAPKAIAYHLGHPEGHGGNPFQVEVTIRNRWLVVLANDDLRDLVYATPDVLRYEIGLLRYVVTTGLSPAYVRALVGFMAQAGRALSKRRHTFRRARTRTGNYLPPLLGSEWIPARHVER